MDAVLEHRPATEPVVIDTLKKNEPLDTGTTLVVYEANEDEVSERTLASVQKSGNEHKQKQWLLILLTC